MKNLPGKLGRGSAKQTLRVLARGGLFVKTINKKSSGLQTCLFAPPSHVFFFKFLATQRFGGTAQHQGSPSA